MPDGAFATHNIFCAVLEGARLLLFCHLQPANPLTARARSRRVQAAPATDEPPSGLFLAALQGEAQVCAAIGLAEEADCLRDRVNARTPHQTHVPE